jgi:hypothetical protein
MFHIEEELILLLEPLSNTLERQRLVFLLDEVLHLVRHEYHLAQIILQETVNRLSFVFVLQLLDHLLEKLILEFLAFHFAARFLFYQTPEIRHEFCDGFINHFDYPVRNFEDFVFAVSDCRSQPFLARGQIIFDQGKQVAQDY